MNRPYESRHLTGYKKEVRSLKCQERFIQYTEEFKRDAVSQVKDRGYSVRDVAERLGVCTKSLYAWVRQYHKPEKSIQEDKEQAAEIRRLRLELVRVKEERDILKKATAYFAKDAN